MSVNLEIMWGDKTLDQAIQDGDVTVYDVDVAPKDYNL